MFVYDNIFKNDGEIRSFVEKAEANYKNQVLKIANDIYCKNQVQTNVNTDRPEELIEEGVVENEDQNNKTC